MIGRSKMTERLHFFFLGDTLISTNIKSGVIPNGMLLDVCILPTNKKIDEKRYNKHIIFIRFPEMFL